MVEFEETSEDLRKIKIRLAIYLIGGIGLAVLGIALLITYGVRRELPALMLGAVGIFWSAMLIYQTVKTRPLVRLLQAKMDEEQTAVDTTSHEEDEEEAAAVESEEEEQAVLDTSQEEDEEEPAEDSEEEESGGGQE